MVCEPKMENPEQNSPDSVHDPLGRSEWQVTDDDNVDNVDNADTSDTCSSRTDRRRLQNRLAQRNHSE